MNRPAPLVMLPGLICDGRIFAPQKAAFSGSIAVQGYDDAVTIGAMAKRVIAMMPPTVSLLGHSMGARVALEVVRHVPERVERLAVVSTGIHPVRSGEAEKRYRLRDLGRQLGMAALVDNWLPPMVGPGRRTDTAFMQPIHTMCCEAGLPCFERHINALLTRPEVDDLLPKLRCPVLVAVGAEDVWSPPEQHCEIAASIPGSHLVVIKGAGHMLPLERPLELNAAVDSWLHMCR